MSEQMGFAEFVALRRDALVRAACLLTGDPHTAEDLVQTALVRVWPRWRRISARGSADAYVRTVLMNVFLTSLRRRRWREVMTGSDAVHDGAVYDDDSVHDDAGRDAVHEVLRDCVKDVYAPADLAGRVESVARRRRTARRSVTSAVAVVTLGTTIGTFAADRS